MSDAYRTIAPFYDRVIEPFNGGLRHIGLRMYPPPPGASILDVGCGTGIQLAAYSETDAQLHGIDRSAAMLQQATRRLGERAKLQRGDATALPYTDGYFDLTITSMFLHELDIGQAKAVLSEVRRTLKHDGRLLVVDFLPGPFRLKGRAIRALTHPIERIAGRRHYRNFRAFLAYGGAEFLADQSGFRIEQERVVSGATMSVALLEPA